MNLFSGFNREGSADGGGKGLSVNSVRKLSREGINNLSFQGKVSAIYFTVYNLS
jgi:hypothetical protein